jgi:hypothetical protein
MSQRAGWLRGAWGGRERNSRIRNLARVTGHILLEGWVDEVFSRDDQPTPPIGAR